MFLLKFVDNNGIERNELIRIMEYVRMRTSKPFLFEFVDEKKKSARSAV